MIDNIGLLMEILPPKSMGHLLRVYRVGYSCALILLLLKAGLTSSHSPAHIEKASIFGDTSLGPFHLDMINQVGTRRLGGTICCPIEKFTFQPLLGLFNCYLAITGTWHLVQHVLMPLPPQQ